MHLHRRVWLVAERLEETTVTGRHQPKGGHAVCHPFSSSICAWLSSFSSLELIRCQRLHIGAHGSHTGLIALVHDNDRGAVRCGLTSCEAEENGKTGKVAKCAHGLEIGDGRAKFYIRVAFALMKVLHSLPALAGALFLISCQTPATEAQADAPESTVADLPDSLDRGYEEEVHLKNVRQLTYGGDNAEAYWSFDGKNLVFQASNPSWGVNCDQIYVMNIQDGTPAKTPPAPVSTGLGRTTCAYYMPGDSTVVYASTHAADTACPEVPRRGPKGEYVWPIYPTYDIYTTSVDGGEPTLFIGGEGYDAEATVSPQGDKVVFTSTRSGDLELYTCDIDGSNIQQVTSELGYDGGAFFSPDGQYLVWRASRPAEGEQADAYLKLLSKGLVQPTAMELFIAKVDGSEQRQITNLGGANWAPYFHPDGEHILFSSNHVTGAFPFNIFMTDIHGAEPVQITFDNAFDSFPMFSPDGERLAFSSNRNNGRTRSTNVFVADWIE